MFKNKGEYERSVRYFKAFYDNSHQAYEGGWKEELLEAINEIVEPYLENGSYNPGELSDLVKNKANLFTNLVGYFGIADHLGKYLEGDSANEKVLLKTLRELLDDSVRLPERIDAFKNYMDEEYAKNSVDNKFPLSLVSTFLAAHNRHEYCFYRYTSYELVEKEFSYESETPKGHSDGERYLFYLGMAKEIMDRLAEITKKPMDLLDTYNFAFWWQYHHPTFDRRMIEENIERLKAEGHWTKARFEYRAEKEAEARMI
jgi:hypothetical protein